MKWVGWCSSLLMGTARVVVDWYVDDEVCNVDVRLIHEVELGTLVVDDRHHCISEAVEMLYEVVWFEPSLMDAMEKHKTT